MFESDRIVSQKDRRLGDEWVDWNGTVDSQPQETDESITTFVLLGGVIIFVFLSLIPLVWYLIKPRMEQISLPASNLIEWFGIGFMSVFALATLAETFWLLKLGKSLFPYRWTEKVLLSILPRAVWLGAKFGVSRDRVGNSFIKIHNLVTKSSVKTFSAERLLVLLPRCLKKEARSEIMSKINGDAFKILTAGGGEEAREAIQRYRPALILALACERDLMSGIKDVAEKIPVLAVANRRPEGPCKNTYVSLEELEEALKFIADRKIRSEN